MFESKDYPVTSGGTDSKGNAYTTETYDRDTYIEKVTRVESTKNDKTDFYVDKESK